MKYAWMIAIALGLLMPAMAQAGGRDRSQWGFSVNIGYSDRGYQRSHYRDSYSYARVSYDYGRSYRHYDHARYAPRPRVYYRPAPVVYYPPPVYREVEYVYCEPVRPVYVRETYRSYDYAPRYSRYGVDASITYRSGGYRYGR